MFPAYWPWSHVAPSPPAKDDPRLDPVEGDAIDELVNWQLARARTDDRK